MDRERSQATHISREEGRRLFGLDPAAYERARPGHPPRVYELLAESCGLQPGARVLEIGPGTGQATRRLLEHGASVVALEPDPALAEHLSSTVRGSLTVHNEPLEDAALPEAAFDLAAAASCFHWVQEDVGLERIFSSLRPGGSVALWWTLFGSDEHPDPFQQALSRALDRDHPPLERSPSAGNEGGPRFALDVEARRAALGRAGFAGLRHELVHWSHTWDTAGIQALYATFSPILRLVEARRAAVLDTVSRVADEHFGGRVEHHLLTSVYTAHRPVSR